MIWGLIPDTELSVRIPEQLAAEQGIDPTELSPPVGEVIDLEALERTVSAAAGGSGPTASTVTFEYDTLTVTVKAAESVDVTVEPTAPTRSRPENRHVAD